MMMGGMGGSGGSMGMDSMMNMGGGASGSMNLGGASMNMTGNMGNMQGMAGMDPSAMNGMVNQMPGWQNGMQGMAGMNQNGLPGLGGGFNLGTLLGGIFNLAIEIFVILLFVGLVIGAVVFVKRYLFEGEILAVKPKAACTRCGQSLHSDWNACPKCGQPKVVPVQAAPQTV